MGGPVSNFIKIVSNVWSPGKDDGDAFSGMQVGANDVKHMISKNEDVAAVTNTTSCGDGVVKESRAEIWADAVAESITTDDACVPEVSKYLQENLKVSAEMRGVPHCAQHLFYTGGGSGAFQLSLTFEADNKDGWPIAVKYAVCQVDIQERPGSRGGVLGNVPEPQLQQYLLYEGAQRVQTSQQIDRYIPQNALPEPRSRGRGGASHGPAIVANHRPAIGANSGPAIGANHRPAIGANSGPPDDANHGPPNASNHGPPNAANRGTGREGPLF